MNKEPTYYRIAIRPFTARLQERTQTIMRLEYHIGADREEVKACQPDTMSQGVRLNTEAGQHRASQALDEWYEQIDLLRMERA